MSFVGLLVGSFPMMISVDADATRARARARRAAPRRAAPRRAAFVGLDSSFV